MTILSRTLIDGVVLSFIASLLIGLTLWLNPRIWLHDYPEDIQAQAPPKTEQEKRLSLVLGIPFLLILVLGPFISTYVLKHQQGDVSFGLLFINAFGVVFIFNVVDWLILDWLMFCTLTPQFLVIPGTEGMESYKDYGFHFRGFLIGSVFSAVAGLVIAGLVMVL